MRGADPFQYGGFKGGRFIDLLSFEHAKCFTDDFILVNITTCVDEPLH